MSTEVNTPLADDQRRAIGLAPSTRWALSSLILSAHVGQNAKVFEQLMELHVPKGSIVADVTYGKGCFWNTMPKGRYNVRATDIKDGVDCRKLPYGNGEIDCLVLDPPYIEGFYRRHTAHLAGTGSHANMRNYYGNHEATRITAKWHGAVREMYLESAKEAYRVLRPKGIFVVKCQDEVSANKQWLTHVEIINDCAELGYYAKDLFVVVRTNRPICSKIHMQAHARKNHSYFLVFEKRVPALPNTHLTNAQRSV